MDRNIYSKGPPRHYGKEIPLTTAAGKRKRPTVETCDIFLRTTLTLHAPEGRVYVHIGTELITYRHEVVDPYRTVDVARYASSESSEVHAKRWLVERTINDCEFAEG